MEWRTIARAVTGFRSAASLAVGRALEGTPGTVSRLFIRPQGGSEAGWLPNFRWVVLGCMDSYDSEKRRILQGFSRSTRFAFLCTALNSNLQSFAPLIFSRSIRFAFFCTAQTSEFAGFCFSHFFAEIFTSERCYSKGAKECKSCRSRKMLENASFLAIVAVDTEENDTSKVRY